MRNGSAINGMFLTPEPAGSDVSRRELTPLQAHFLAQFAHALAVRAVAAFRNDGYLQPLVERVIAARYRDCVSQGVAQGARALVANDARRQRAWPSR